MILLLENCYSQSKIIKYNMSRRYCDINNLREVVSKKDTVYLWPFELYDTVLFKDVFFSSLGDDQIYIDLKGAIISGDYKTDKGLFGSFVNNFEINKNEIFYSSESNSGYKWAGSIIKIKLETIDGILVREIRKGQKYKIIYCFKSDSDTHRTNIPTEHNDGYYIVDIISLNEKFLRQIPF